MHSHPIHPPSRLLMSQGPINADPRVLRVMSAPLVGQYDPAMTAYMTETMALYREVFATALAAFEAAVRAIAAARSTAVPA